MATKEEIRSMREWLALAGADGRVTPFDLRVMSSEAPIVAARELGFEARGEEEARERLRTFPAVLEALDRFRDMSEALARYREQSQRVEDEDRRLQRDRIGAREALIAAVESATGRKLK